jgi:hypothetical protein
MRLNVTMKEERECPTPPHSSLPHSLTHPLLVLCCVVWCGVHRRGHGDGRGVGAGLAAGVVLGRQVAGALDGGGRGCGGRAHRSGRLRGTRVLVPLRGQAGATHSCTHSLTLSLGCHSLAQLPLTLLSLLSLCVCVYVCVCVGCRHVRRGLH